MRYAALILAVTLTPAALLAARSTSKADPSVDVPLVTNFSVDATTAIPGAKIAAGQYTISVVEHLTDRVILRVADKDGKIKSMFLGLTTTALQPTGSSGPILWTGKGETALRGFTFPGAPPVEFVYPKNEAVAIAKDNSDKVLAIDPASDNLSVAHHNLSRQDMQIVTLWTLRSTRVGPDAEPAIAAAKYVVPSPQAPTAGSVEVAAATPPARPGAAPRAVASRPTQATSAPRKHAISTLPHTASDLPAMLLAAVLTFTGAAALRVGRLYASDEV